MEQRYTSQLHKATSLTPGFDDLARGVRETPLTKRITSTPTPKFGSVSFPSYSVHIQSVKTTKDLWGVVQGPNEALRAYIKRFSKAICKISGLDNGTAREALKKGLRHKCLFKNKICTRYLPTIQDAMHHAKGFIDLEEEN
ncbi:hypothetical protein TIFTF001_049067 [Ficus carica]|uniref:Retrotransposon gag domain-containing protein n=1 Tax=Ficus carica TaxID=3494 RepID=A0AA87YVM9_FICCA|nr:hypothetical protein TIFTF001_049056 [Ficus carica]GMN23098.1 hypothetical protein TIFTF001_049061 [Ficus carica]GMN23117.1 hypothetical protein TIFTF001_049062 [Ficus carica]GMN23137.1 hypothetical protein TIFTF001_049067 [Ficus carica]